MSDIDILLSNNSSYAAEQHRGELSSAPARQLAVVTCMDARIDVYAVLGLQPGQAHVIRNAGGIVTDDVVRSLAISQRMLGTRDVMLIHHSGCGMLGVDDDAVAADLAEETGEAPSWRAGGFSDLDEDVRLSIQRVTGSAYLPGRAAGGEVRGFVVDVQTGRLREVIP